MNNKIFSASVSDLEVQAQIKALKGSFLANMIERPELEMLLSHSNIISFNEKEIILQQGKKLEGFYIILSGTVVINARVMGEGATTIETLGPGGFIGEVSFIEKKPCATSAIAQNEVKCLLITTAYFELLRIYSPETKYKILKAVSVQLCQRIKRMHDKVAEFITDSDMASLSFLGRVIHSITQPRQLSLQMSGVDPAQLQKKPIFQSFTQQEMDELFNQAIFLEASKNCILIQEGIKNSDCYLIIHGAVQSSIMKNNKIAKLSVIGPGSLFASIACIDHHSSFTLTFITCESALLLKIPEAALNHFQQTNPQLWYKLFALICESLVALSKSIDKLDIRLHIETYNR